MNIAVKFSCISPIKSSDKDRYIYINICTFFLQTDTKIYNIIGFAPLICFGMDINSIYIY